MSSSFDDIRERLDSNPLPLQEQVSSIQDKSSLPRKTTWSRSGRHYNNDHVVVTGKSGTFDSNVNQLGRVMVQEEYPAFIISIDEQAQRISLSIRSFGMGTSLFSQKMSGQQGQAIGYFLQAIRKYITSSECTVEGNDPALVDKISAIITPTSGKTHHNRLTRWGGLSTEISTKPPMTHSFRKGV